MEWFSWVLLLLTITFGLISALHALLHKHDSRSALTWSALCLIYPIVGSFIYYVFGINRKQRRAKKKMHLDEGFCPYDSGIADDNHPHAHELKQSYQGLSRLSGIISSHNLLTDNHVRVLYNGDETYPEMLANIYRAKRYIYFCTYIFNSDDVGNEFIAALSDAVKRGVQVRVLLDGFGQYYSWPHSARLCRKHGIPVAIFNKPKLFPFNMHVNMRNHRKILVIDGECAFTGGMNINLANVHNSSTKHPISDIHFYVKGDVINQIEQAFIEDWFATCNEQLEAAESPTTQVGTALARTIEDGPNERISKLSLLMTAAVHHAKQSIWIMTPYFIPYQELILALQTAALRGVEVNILLPAKNNLPFVDWAMRHILPRLLEYEVNVYFRPAPFSHSKLFIIDEYYSHLGSANVDPRSLRLNFELSLEVYDEELAEELVQHCLAVKGISHQLTLEQSNAQGLPTKVRNALMWLFSPYL